jgi:GNAT superfamily N-acetyltransferase
VRYATANDVPLLVDLMAAFYAEAGYRLDGPVAKSAFAAILADERLGKVWIIEDGSLGVGHLVVTYRVGMEYSGLIACIDDLYVTPSHRNKGLATAALLHVRACCEEAGIRALTVEVGHGNGPARAVYDRIGLVEAPDRRLLALALAAPIHAA